jgi:hypothetical protein
VSLRKYHDDLYVRGMFFFKKNAICVGGYRYGLLSLSS